MKILTVVTRPAVLLLVIGASPTVMAGMNCPDLSNRTYDVIIVGAGTSGTMAAIQAARRPNTRVALIEPGNVIGGQIVASGVSTMDGGFNPPVLSGLYLDYVGRVIHHYNDIGLSPHTCYGGPPHICSEPHVSEQILQDMLDDPVAVGSTLCPFKNTSVVEVLQDVTPPYRVRGVRTGTGPTDAWKSHVLIDATEYGDLLPMTFGDYRVGNWRRFSGSTPSPDACVQDITYTAIIRKYAPLPVPQIPEPDGYCVPGQLCMANVFWTWVSDNPPSSYPGSHPYPFSCPWSWAGFNAYRGLPDSATPNPMPGPVTRTQSNYEVTDFPGYWVESGGGCVPGVPPPVIVHDRGNLPISFIEDATTRATKICEAKHLSLQFLHYMQRTSPEEQPDWSIADDEYNSPNVCYPWYHDLAPFERQIPPMPYVRESRRIVSIDPLTGSEIKRDGPEGAPTTHRHHSSLAVGDFQSHDMHGCNAPENLESGPGSVDALDTPSDFTIYTGAFQIPFETFIPSVIDGFLPAEKNLGYSRIAATAARMQPSTMLVGQAAGALAALAAANGVQPRDVRVLDVQRALLEGEDPAALAVETFTDVPLGDPRWRDVQLVAVHEVMDGFGGGPANFTFGPSAFEERTDVAAVLGRIFPMPPALPGTGTYVDREQLAEALATGVYGSLPAEGSPPAIFEDVPVGYPHRGAIESLYNDGFMKECAALGSSMKWFCPSGPEKVRREVVAHAAAEVMLQIWP